jgi:BASS family bile acid:Na+ symporter
MQQFLATLLRIAVPLFAVSSMLSVGIRFPARDILEPLRHRLGVLATLVANFALVPILAWVIDEVVNLDTSYETGLILIASAAGAPFLVKLTKVARGDMAHATGLLTLLLLVTIIYMPIAVKIAVPEATVNTRAIAQSLFLTMLIPLAIGQLARWKAPGTSQRLLPWLAHMSTYSLLALIALTAIVNFREILGIIGEGAIMTAVLLISGSFGIGYLFGGTRRQRDVNGLATAQRNIAAAMVVAQDFSDRGVLVMVVVASLVDLAVLFPIARALRKRREKKQTEVPAQQGRAA